VPDISFAKDISIIIAGIVAFVTFAFGLSEYLKRNKQDRAAHFIAMRRRFLETPEFRRLLEMLHMGDEEIARAPVQDKRNFIGFFEEVALLVNSGLLRRDVAHYMYGHYVLLADESDGFWQNLDRGSIYWTVFRKFAADMRDERSTRHPLRLAI